jgi:hypothetical protein
MNAPHQPPGTCLRVPHDAPRADVLAARFELRLYEYHQAAAIGAQHPGDCSHHQQHRDEGQVQGGDVNLRGNTVVLSVDNKRGSE